MIDILFPKICLLCDNSSKKDIICSSCYLSFGFIDNSRVCDVCGVPFLGLSEQKLHLCGSCINNTESLLKVRSVLLYKDKLKDLLHGFKYGSKLYIAGFLSDLIIDNFPSDLRGFDTVVPVPLHIRRLRERGYNQTVLISKVLAGSLGVSLDSFSLKKIRDSRPQVDMSNFQSRAKNVKNAFMVSNKKVFSGKTVLLFDDVYTSGSTIKECSKQLIESGAKYVFALTLARAV
jgi:ComF family protein